jgi:hypothetical protein
VPPTPGAAAIGQQASVDINEILIRPTAQPNQERVLSAKVSVPKECREVFEGGSKNLGSRVETWIM